METGSLVAIYTPIIVIMIIIIMQNQAAAYMASRRKRKRGRFMNNEMLEKSVGKMCWISSGSYGASVKGTVLAIKDSWLEVEATNGKTILVNSEYIQQIKML